MEDALMERVVSQENGFGRASDTATLTMRPVMIAARFPRGDQEQPTPP